MMIFKLKRLLHICLIFSAVLASGLAGCSEFKTAENGVQQESMSADRALQQIAPKSAIAQPLTIDKRPYFGSQAIPITTGTPLPGQFEQNGSIVMTFARPVTMPELMRMIQAVTGLRANAPASSALVSAAGESDTQKTFIPSDGEQVAGGRVVWQGKLSDLLNQASDVFDAEWSYDGSAIQFAQQITRTFMLHSLSSELSVSGSVKSGTSEGGGNLPQVDVTSTSSLKVWDEIKEAVNTITGSNGKAAFSPSTGTITVTAAPDVVRRVEAYLSQQNSMRLRRVAVAIKIISVTTSDALALTGSLTGIIKRAFDQARVRTIGDATSGLAIGILKAPTDTTTATQIDSDRLLSELTALKNVERAAISHSGALVTLSDQPAPLQVGRQISYLARTSSTSGDTGGSVSLEPGTVNTGLMMTVLPRIVEQNRILMRLSVAITDAQQPFASFGTGSGDTRVEIQLPEVDTTGFLQNAVVTSGETMVLAGFEKNENSSSSDGAPVVPLLTGGTKASNKVREVTIMMITAEILPEDPISVIGQ